MNNATKHINIFRALTTVLLLCYVSSPPLFHQPNEIVADLSKIILHLQNSTESFTPKSNIDNATPSDSIRILKSIAGLNFMQVNTDESDQGTVTIELKTPHLLSAKKDLSSLRLRFEPMDLKNRSYVSFHSPPDTPPPIRVFV